MKSRWMLSTGGDSDAKLAFQKVPRIQKPLTVHNDNHEWIFVDRRLVSIDYPLSVKVLVSF